MPATRYRPHSQRWAAVYVLHRSFFASRGVYQRPSLVYERALKPESSTYDGGPVKDPSVDLCSVSFILRCWQEEESADDRQSVWRFSIQEIGAERRRIGFSRLEYLFAYLEAQLMSTRE